MIKRLLQIQSNELNREEFALILDLTVIDDKSRFSLTYHLKTL